MARRFLLRFREAEVKVRDGVETFTDTNLRDGEYSSPVNTSNEYEYWAQARSRDPCVHSTSINPRAAQESTTRPMSCPPMHKTLTRRDSGGVGGGPRHITD